MAEAIGDDGSEMPEAYDAAPQQPEEDDDDDVLDLAEVGEAVPPLISRSNMTISIFRNEDGQIDFDAIDTGASEEETKNWPGRTP